MKNTILYYKAKMHCIKDTGGIMKKFYCINMSFLTVR